MPTHRVLLSDGHWTVTSPGAGFEGVSPVAVRMTFAPAESNQKGVTNLVKPALELHLGMEHAQWHYSVRQLEGLNDLCIRSCPFATSTDC